MKKILIALFFTTSIAFSQGKITKALGEYHTVKVFNGLEVELIKSNKNRIEITGEKADEVVVKNVNETVKLSLSLLEKFSRDDVHIKLYYADKLHTINANEASFIVSADKIKQQNLDVKAESGAKIKLDINIEYLQVRSYSGAEVFLEGKAKNQDVSVNTGGFYTGKELVTNYTDITCSTGGQAHIYAKDMLDANSSLGATIKYVGEPKSIKKQKSLGGNIYNKD